SEDGGNFVKLDATDKNFYVDYAVTAAKTYTYRVGTLSDTIKDEVTGKSIISGIKIESGIVTDRTASIIVTFVTDKLAKSQVLYGRNGVADQKTELDESLNHSHTTLIGNLKPNTAYSFFLRAIDKSGVYTTDSAVQNFTTPPAPVDPSLLEIIIKALQSALAGFGKLFTK
ncbi:MAG TPA: fibronectin type III domain-containing protein, partial [Patescibacteria group bacterium]|nr:fibronectin type III domain-containing protein [Patescibacteria group bacterium]